MANLDYHAPNSSLPHLRGNDAPRPKNLNSAESAVKPNTDAPAKTDALHFVINARPIVLAVPPLALLGGLSVLALAAQQDARPLHSLPASSQLYAADSYGAPDYHALPPGTLPPGAHDPRMMGNDGMPNPLMAPVFPGQGGADGGRSNNQSERPRGNERVAALGGSTQRPERNRNRDTGSRPDRVDPNNPAAVAFQRGVSAQQKKQFPQAITAYQEVLRHDRKALPAHINLAIIYLQTNRREEALPHLQQAAKLDSKNPALHAQLAETLLALKRPKDAIKPLRQVIELAPDNRVAQAALAQALAETNQYPQAYQQWTQLANSDAKDGQAAFAAAAIAHEKLNRPDEAAKWAQQAWQSNQWKKNAAKNHPGDPRVPILLSRLLEAQKKPAEAETVLAAGAAEFPEVAELHTRLADLRWQQDNKDGAIQALRAAVGKVPAQSTQEAGQLRIALGRAYAMQQQWPAALGELKQATTLLPKDAEARALFGEALLRSGRKPEAITHLRQALTLDSKNRSARLLLADAYMSDNKLDAARNEYTTYLKAYPKDVDALADYAGLLEKQNKFAESAATWDTVRRLAPNNPAPVLQRARMLRKLNRQKDALELYQAALKIAPNDGNALIGLAETEAELGNKEKSLDYWKQVVAARPDYDAAYPALLQTAASEGQLDATAQFLKSQIEKTPDRRAAYDAILERYAAIGQEAQGRAWVEDFSRRHPQVKAPREALTEFDKKQAVPEKTPAASTEPTSTETPTPTSMPDNLLITPDGELHAAPREQDQPEATASETSMTSPLPEVLPLGSPKLTEPLQITPRYEPPRLTLAAIVTNPQLWFRR